MSLSHLENLDVVPTPQGTPTSVLARLGGRVEHESQRGGVFLRKLRSEEHLKLV